MKIICRKTTVYREESGMSVPKDPRDGHPSRRGRKRPVGLSDYVPGQRDARHALDNRSGKIGEQRDGK
jgi:hypothetical protein